MLGAAAGHAWAAPGTPGVMARPTVVLYEGFENSGPATATFVQTISDYVSAAGTAPGYVGVQGETYAADPQWNGQFCNGLIVSQSDVATIPAIDQTADCSTSGWNSSRNLAETLGLWAEDPDYPYPLLPVPDPLTNNAVTAYTEGDSPPGLMASTVVAATTGHYYSASVDLAQANCWATNPVDLSLTLDDGTGSIAVFPGPIASCETPVHTLNGDNVGTFVGTNALLATATSVQVSLRNEIGGGGGDDNAFDNLAVIDTTPQLDAAIAPGPRPGGAYESESSARLTLAVTNTHLAGFPSVPSGSKAGWSFTLALPAGLRIADTSNAQTDCANGALTASGTTVIGNGDLGPLDVMCTLAFDVTSTSGSYAIDPAGFTLVGLLPPAPATVSFAGAELPPAGAGPGFLAAGALGVMGAGLLLLLMRGALRIGITSSSDRSGGRR
jgi:hypothetical protein